MHKVISLRDRLKRLSLFLAVSFILIVIVLFYSLNGVRKNIDGIVATRFSEVVENSHNSRDFGLLYTRIRIFTDNFYGDPDFVAVENNSLIYEFERLSKRIVNEQIGAQIGDLEKAFRSYLHQCEWINVLLDWRQGQDEDINEQLLLLQEIVSEQIIKVALTGGDISYLEQLIQLISGYRENLLEISKLNALENKEDLLNSSATDPPPLQQQFKQLILRMQTLTASEPPIDKFGQHLISSLKYYQHLMRLYQLEMVLLGEQERKLENLAGDVLLSMERADQQSVLSAAETRQVIDHTIISTLILVLFLLALLAALAWFSLGNFWGRHVRGPMMLARSRIEKFQGGDLETPMALQREDEWNEFEQVFNQMLIYIQDNVSALVDSEMRYREIFTNANEGIFRTSISGKILEINPSAIAMLGYESRDQAISKVFDFGSVHYVDPKARKNMLSQLYRKNKIRQFECQLVRQNGERFWASINNRLVRNGKGEILYIEGTMQDISIRKAAQESLIKLQVYLQNIIDSMPSILIAIDPDLNISMWNKRAELDIGIPASQAIGTPFEQSFRLIKAEVYQDSLRETLKSLLPARLIKLKSEGQDADATHYYDMLIYPLSNDKNRGAVIHIDDVSERVQLEDMMVRSEKMQSVGSLASGLAHEINNPLAAVLQNVQVLNHRISPSLAKNRTVAEELGTTIEIIAEYCERRGFTKMLNSISSAGRRAAKIVENIQSFSRRGDSGFSLSSLPDLIDRTLDLAASDYDMRHKFAFHKIKIHREFQPTEKLMCEPSQIQQVILSLLKNAAQALSGHGEAPCITLRTYAPDQENICLEIEDNGPGMSDETVRCIFDPFYSTRDVGSGTGLGLSIAYFIISQNHRGSLTVRTDIGKGTCFVMVLPLNPTA